ncbi:7-carboxy-7-deazaguanine synthase QueE [Synechocystis sp. LKSZ1]|uniref:7-carboxy-7-deazaguanine synthase QueE n=1 Tax=Synechocystis sp. LKSZ1 TaxID=3144951 RepID=UPI00336BC483
MTAVSTITYPVVETFHSLQGEGRWAGSNAFFIRLGGCDVHCPWCDQKETWRADRYPQVDASDLNRLAVEHQPAMVVITGGEPLLHNLQPLTTALRETKLRLHLETSGAYPLTGEFDWITLSPKPYKPPHPSLYHQAQELKVVITNAQDLAWAEAQAKQVSAETLKYLQPEWNSPEGQTLIVDYILAHPQWQLSLQTHKYLGVR